MKTRNEVWVQFASTALSTVLPISEGMTFESISANAAKLADAMTAEWEKRQPREFVATDKVDGAWNTAEVAKGTL